MLLDVLSIFCVLYDECPVLAGHGELGRHIECVYIPLGPLYRWCFMIVLCWGSQWLLVGASPLPLWP